MSPSTEAEDEYLLKTRYPCHVKFRLGWNTIHGVAELPRFTYRHILRVTLVRSRLQRILIALLPYLPRPVQTLATRLWPACQLPARVYVKKLKPDCDGEFERERNAYGRLKSLQGRLIPVLYGETCMDGTRALVLSEIDGVVACEQPRRTRLTADEFKERLEVAFREMHAYGLTHEDPKPTNVLLVGDKIVFVDLESVFEEENMDEALVSNVSQFVKWYKKYLENCRIEEEQEKDEEMS